MKGVVYCVHTVSMVNAGAVLYYCFCVFVLGHRHVGIVVAWLEISVVAAARHVTVENFVSTNTGAPIS